MLSTFIKLLFVIKIIVLSIFEWSLKTVLPYSTKSRTGCTNPLLKDRHHNKNLKAKQCNFLRDFLQHTHIIEKNTLV